MSRICMIPLFRLPIHLKRAARFRRCNLMTSCPTTIRINNTKASLKESGLFSQSGDKRATTLNGFSRIFHNFIRFNIHILSDRNRTTPTHSHIVTRFGQAYRSIPNDFRRVASKCLDQIRHTAPPRTGTGETIGAIVRNQ